MQAFTNSKIKILATVTVTGFLAAILSILFLDQSVAVFFSNPDFSAFRIHARDITNIGEAVYWFALAFVALGLGYGLMEIKKRWPQSRLARLRGENLKNWSLHFLASLILSGLLLHLIKFSVGRQRPHLSPTFDPFVFSPFNWHWHWQSFPSGHTQTIACVAMNLSLAMPNRRYLILLLAVGLAMTRVLILQHFLGDVIAGATLGWLGTSISLLWLQRKVPLPEPFL